MSDPNPISSSTKKLSADGKVYYKSASSNATEAPTNEVTLANREQRGTLTPDELDFVTIVHYEYGLSGTLPHSDFLQSEYKYDANTVLQYYSSEGVKAALSERGVELTKHEAELDLKPTNPGKPKLKLTPLQLVVANSLLDLTDTKSEKKKLQDLGISTKVYQSWLRDPDFSHYLRERAEAMIGDVQHEAMLALVDGVRSGNINHIKYYHSLTGRYVEPSAASNGSSSHDLQTILIRVVEILNDEIDDPAVAARISDKLRGLVMGGAVAAALTSEPEVIIPEIAKPREQTEAVKALMAKGVGYDQ